jgi:hypothetical protein
MEKKNEIQQAISDAILCDRGDEVLRAVQFLVTGQDIELLSEVAEALPESGGYPSALRELAARLQILLDLEA